MSSLAHKVAIEPRSSKPVAGDIVQIYRVPQITIDAYCETPEVIDAIERSFADRRMARSHSSVHAGGIAAAITHYQETVSPNLLIVETLVETQQIRAQLDALADVCHPGTKVIVLGHRNDVELYRDLLDQGISEYVVVPTDPVAMIAIISRLYREPDAAKLGRSLAFIGAKGGVGSSTIAHNVAATIGRLYAASVILADLDLPFGTTSLDCKIELGQGTAEALQDSSRLDDMLLERLLNKREKHLSVLTSPAALELAHERADAAYERLLEVAQAHAPFVVLDIPHVWTSWARKVLLAADEVVITATPDLASLRNAKSLVDLLKQARANDGPPKLVLNQLAMPKRTEIKPDQYAAALQLEPVACIRFDPSAFSKAGNEGHMLADAAPKAAACEHFVKIAQSLTGLEKPKKSWKDRFSLKRVRKD